MWLGVKFTNAYSCLIGVASSAACNSCACEETLDHILVSRKYFMPLPIIPDSTTWYGSQALSPGFKTTDRKEDSGTLTYGFAYVQGHESPLVLLEDHRTSRAPVNEQREFVLCSFKLTVHQCLSQSSSFFSILSFLLFPLSPAPRVG
uniref:Tick transposon n=1 Tax=Rhipicephalus appendiculatus TaxID=34631 RepID=A0A131YKK7_RHIAP